MMLEATDRGLAETHTHLSAVTEAFRLGVQWLFGSDPEVSV